MFARTTLRRTANRMRFAAPLAVLMLMITTALAQAAAPGAPGSIALTDGRSLAATGTSTISLDWNPVGGASCYHVFRSETQPTPPAAPTNSRACGNGTGGSIGSPTTSYFEDTVPNGTTKYYYYVVAVASGSGGGTSSGSPLVVTNSAPTTGADADTIDEDADWGAYNSWFISNDVSYTGANGFGETSQSLTVDRSTGNGVTALTNPAHGTFVYINYGNYWYYAPDTNFHGTDSFQVRVCDNGARKLCTASTLTFTIKPVNDRPDATNDAYTINEDTTTDFNVLSNDTTGGGSDESTQTLTLDEITQQGTKGAATIVDGKLHYVPNANANGGDTVKYRVCDNGTSGSPATADPKCNTATVTITITAVNDAPVASASTLTVAEDAAATTSATDVNVLANVTKGGGSDENGQTLTLSTVPADTTALHGTASIVSGKVRYKPDANYAGSDTITYKVCDNGTPVACANGVVNVTVTPVNDAPVAANDSASTLEDTPLNGTSVLNNDSKGGGTDEESQTLSAVLVTGPAKGSLTLNADGTYTYTPTLNTNGTDTFTYKAKDNGTGNLLSTSAATVTITVAAVNDAPVANADLAATAEDTPVVIDVLHNDTRGGGSDENSQTLRIAGITGSNYGTATVTEDDQIRFTPNTNYNGNAATVSYQVCDSGTPSECATATATITVTPVNDAPIAADDVVSTDEDTFATFDVVGNDDAGAPDETNVLKASNLTQPEHGTVSVVSGKVLYTPEANYNGPDSFTYRAREAVSDGGLLSNVATVTVTVNAVNDAPVATADIDQITDEDNVGSFPILDNDNSGGGAYETAQALYAKIITPGTKGTASADRRDGVVTYTPNADATGEDTFTYQACEKGEGGLCSETVTVTVTINAINDAPVADDDAASTDEDTPVIIDVLDNDTPGGGEDEAGQRLLPTIIGQGSKGTASLQARTGEVTYTPDLNANGTDSFTYQACETGDAPLCSETVTVTVTINAVNDAPVAVDDAVATDEDTPATFDVTSNDDTGAADETNVLKASTLTQPAHGTVEVSSGKVLYTPDANFNGTDSFTYKTREAAADGGLFSAAAATVTVTVNAVNDTPTVKGDEGITLAEDSSLAIDVVANDSDGAPDEHNGLVPTDVSTPEHGTAVVVQGKVTYTPDANYAGEDSFTYKAIETVGGTLKSARAATVLVVVSEINDAPTATDHVVSVDEDDTLDLDVTTGATRGGGDDEAGQTLTFEVVGTTAHGALTLNADGSGTYEPEADYFGADSFTYEACDNGTTAGADAGTCSLTKTVTITVDAVNDAPTAPEQDVTLDEDDTLELNLLAGANAGPDNEETDELSATVTAGPTNGTLVDGLYTPNANFHGTDTVTTRVCDAGLPIDECVDSAINITVVPINDAPVAVADTEEIAEDDSALTIDVLDNDTDVESDELTVSAPTVAAAAGTVEVVENEVVYTAAKDFNGTATITYTVTDDGVSGSPAAADQQSDEGTLTVTVTEVNDDVVATDDDATVAEDATLTLGSSDLTGDDSAGPANESTQTLTITSVQDADNGSVSIEDGEVTFTPTADYNGPASFTYTVRDNGTTDSEADATSDTATVEVTVTAVNDAPVATAEAVATDEDVAVTTPEADLIGDDSKGPANEAAQELTLASVQGAVGGTVAIVAGDAVFTPTADSNSGTNAASYTYTVCDDGGLIDGDEPCDTATVTVTVAAVNDKPVADDEAGVEVVENGSVLVDVLDGDVAGPADETNTLEIANVSAPAHGTAVVDNGKIRYTPAADYNGTDTFTYEAHETSDGSLYSAAATVTVRVLPNNKAPLATDGAFSAKEGETTTINLATLVSDIETSDANLTYVIDAQPTHGTLSGTGAVRTYTSAAGYGGVDSIKFHVVDAGDPSECGAVNANCDSKLSSNVATVTLNVTATPVVVTPPPVVDTPGQADTTDRTKPTVTYQSVKLPFGKARANGLTVKVKTNKRAKTVVTIYLNVREAKFLGFKTTKPLIIGTGVVEGDGGVQNIKINLTFKGKQAIARRSQPTLHLQVRVASTNAFGTGNASGTITVIKPKR